MYYSRYDDRRIPTWSLTSGTARMGYPASALGTNDPSELCWIEETEIAVQANLGSALEVQAVFLHNHNFSAGTDVRLQATGIDVGFTIPTWYGNGYAPDVWIDLVAAVPSVATRTKQTWTITNVGDANTVAVAIGEIWIAGTWRLLGPQSVGHDYSRSTEDLSVMSTGKRGVQTVYDFGSRARVFTGRVRTTSPDTVLDWYDTQHGRVYPSVVVLDPAGDTVRDREPHLCRFAVSRRELVSLMHDTVGEIALPFDELGRGELISPTGSPS